MELCNRYRTSSSPNSILSVTPADSSPQGFQRAGSQVGFTSDKFKGLAMIPERLPNQITLWTILLERFTMKFWEVSTWHRFQNSSWHDGIVPWHQDPAAWGTVWLIFDMVNFACTTLMSFEFSQGRSSAIASNRCIMAVFFLFLR